MSFGGDLGKFTDKVEEATTKVLRGSSLEVLSSVIRRTPVKTGRLRGNWQTSLNSMASGEVDDRESAALSRAKSETSKMKISDAIYMMNNLPYAQKIEDGSSAQAPSGMIRSTILEWMAVVNKKARENKV